MPNCYNSPRKNAGEILEQLWRLEEAAEPTEAEKALLDDDAQAAFDANPDGGAPWAEVEARLRRRS